MMFVYENIIDYFLSPLFFSFGLSLITLSCVLKMPPTLSKRRTTPSLALLPPSSLFVRASPLRNTFLPPHLCCQKCFFPITDSLCDARSLWRGRTKPLGRILSTPKWGGFSINLLNCWKCLIDRVLKVFHSPYCV